MGDAGVTGDPNKLSSGTVPGVVNPGDLQALVAAEVQRQLDRERLILRDAGNLALKIIGGSFALLIAVFTIFGLNTWSGVSQTTKEYMQRKVDDLVGRTDSETGVKQTLNDLVNHAIVASELTNLNRKQEGIELPKYEWDRLKAWLQVDGLSIEDFTDTVTLLNAQSDDRKNLDANGTLKYMLSPQGGKLHEVVKNRPDKIDAILSNFEHSDLGAAAMEIAQSSNLSEDLRIRAINYVRTVKYTDGFEKIMAIENSSESGPLKQAALVACAVLRPSNKSLLVALEKLATQPATADSLRAAARVIGVWWFNKEIDQDAIAEESVQASTKNCLISDLSMGCI